MSELKCGDCYCCNNGCGECELDSEGKSACCGALVFVWNKESGEVVATED